MGDRPGQTDGQLIRPRRYKGRDEAEARYDEAEARYDEAEARYEVDRLDVETEAVLLELLPDHQVSTPELVTVKSPRTLAGAVRGDFVIMKG
jgi:hypothetical protein